MKCLFLCYKIACVMLSFSLCLLGEFSVEERFEGDEVATAAVAKRPLPATSASDVESKVLASECSVFSAVKLRYCFKAFSIIFLR